MMPLASHHGDTGAKGMTWPKKLCSSSFDHQVEWCHWWQCWHDVTLIPASMTLHDQKSYVASHFNYLDWRNALVPLMMPLALHDADASGITWPKSHVTSSFDHLDLTNRMMQLMSLLASCDTDTSIMALHDWKSSTHCFNHLDIMNTMVLFTIALASSDVDASANSVKWLKNLCCISFQSPWTNKTTVLLMMPLASCDANTGIT